MRIGDWSSDVCSSDLGASTICWAKSSACPMSGEAGAGTYRHWLRILQSGWSVISVGPRLNGSSLIGVGRSRSKDFSPSMMRDWPQRQEIGRASCRERVCQYVSISVVAVSLKKKLTKIIVSTRHYNSYHKNKHD